MSPHTPSTPRDLIAEARAELSKIRFGTRQSGKVILGSHLELIRALAEALESTLQAAPTEPAVDLEREGDAPTVVGSAPTEDEREAAAQSLHRAVYRHLKLQDLTADERDDTYRQADAILAAGSRLRGSVTPERYRTVECPHWAPGRITLRSGCTACAAESAR